MKNKASPIRKSKNGLESAMILPSVTCSLLEEQGLLKRTHGGAIPLRNIGFQPGIGNLSSKERAQKVLPNYLAIAKRAVQCIEENDVIYITSASIGYLMV